MFAKSLITIAVAILVASNSGALWRPRRTKAARRPKPVRQSAHYFRVHVRNLGWLRVALRRGQLSHRGLETTYSFPHQRTVGRFSKQEIPVLTRTSIALAIIVALASGAIAAEKRQQRAWGYYGHQQLGNCAHGTWDVYGLRCDAAN